MKRNVSVVRLIVATLVILLKKCRGSVASWTHGISVQVFRLQTEPNASFKTNFQL